MKSRKERKDRKRILFAFVSACADGKNLNTAIWSSMADDTITRGGIAVLRSPFFICGKYPPLKQERLDMTRG